MSWIGETMLSIHNWRHGVGKVKSSLKKNSHPLRIGVLGVANINYPAIIDTTQTHPDAVVVGLAARELARAEAQISKYKIGSTCRPYGSYDELLADPSIDAVYIPLPNGLHAEWAIKAMEAGKHVLIEKPIASNAKEARRIQEAAARTDKVALEAFHWRFHPAAHIAKSIIESGKYGAPTSIYTCMFLAAGGLAKDDIRFQYGLAGGSCMDFTYVFSSSTYFASTDITKSNFDVLRAKPRVAASDSRVDEAMDAEFIISQPEKPPVHCRVETDAAVPPLFGFIPRFWVMTPFITIELERAKIEFTNHVLPSYFHSIVVTEKDNKGKFTNKKYTESCYKDGPQWHERGEPWWTTYRWQLEAFVSKVRAKQTQLNYRGPWMSLQESEKIVTLIDLVYEKAGMPLRGT